MRQVGRRRADQQHLRTEDAEPDHDQQQHRAEYAGLHHGIVDKREAAQHGHQDANHRSCRPPKKRSVAQPARYDPAAAPIAITKNCSPALPTGTSRVSIRCVTPQSRKPYRQAFSKPSDRPRSQSGIVERPIQAFRKRQPRRVPHRLNLGLGLRPPLVRLPARTPA